MVGDMIQTGYQNGSDHSHFLYPDRETAAAAGIVFLIQEKIFHGFLILPKQHVSVKAAPLQRFHRIVFSAKPVFIVKIGSVSCILEYRISVIQTDADGHRHQFFYCHIHSSQLPARRYRLFLSFPVYTFSSEYTSLNLLFWHYSEPYLHK